MYHCGRSYRLLLNPPFVADPAVGGAAIEGVDDGVAAPDSVLAAVHRISEVVPQHVQAAQGE